MWNRRTTAACTSTTGSFSTIAATPVLPAMRHARGPARVSTRRVVSRRAGEPNQSLAPTPPSPAPATASFSGGCRLEIQRPRRLPAEAGSHTIQSSSAAPKRRTPGSTDWTRAVTARSAGSEDPPYELEPDTRAELHLPARPQIVTKNLRNVGDMTVDKVVADERLCRGDRRVVRRRHRGIHI